MNYWCRNQLNCSLWALLICATFWGNKTLGQTLSIIKKAESNYWIEATAPQNNPHALQGSPNLHLWVDIREDVQQPYTFQFDTAGVFQRYYRLKPSSPPAEPIRLLLIGDSMAADCCGWGPGLNGYIKENVTFVNYATPWYSTKIFLQSEEWEKMLLIKPDYVLVQFGWMDGSTDPDRGTTLQEFGDNLRLIVNTVRGFNGIPILVTLHAARSFDATGKLVASPNPRNTVTKQLAAELNTPLIDLYQLSFDLFNELGPKGCEFMHWIPGGPEDVMHFSALGAVYIARLVANEVPDTLGPYLTGILDQPPKP
jgi:lysophospholipase L1-like esterase